MANSEPDHVRAATARESKTTGNNSPGIRCFRCGAQWWGAEWDWGAVENKHSPGALTMALCAECGVVTRALADMGVEDVVMQEKWSKSLADTEG